MFLFLDSISINIKPASTTNWGERTGIGAEETKEGMSPPSGASPISVPQMNIKNVDDIEKLLANVQSIVDTEAADSADKRTKEQIARCLGLIP